jgi:hypothetical protein
MMNITPNVNAISTQIINTDATTRQMTTDPTKAIVAQTVASESVSANVAAVKAQDEMHGSLLDIKG